MAAIDAVGTVEIKTIVHSVPSNKAIGGDKLHSFDSNCDRSPLTCVFPHVDQKFSFAFRTTTEMKIPFHRNAQHLIKSNFILEAMDNRKQVKTLVLLELSKNFDSIEYGILLRKRLGLGFKGSHGDTLHEIRLSVSYHTNFS